jgi:hypothetical protein
MKNLILSSVLLIFFSGLSFGQIAVNQNGSTADPSAMLDISSTTKGLLIPRMNSVQRENISTTQTGLLVFDTDDSSFYYYKNSGWVKMVTDGETGWSINGDTVYNSNSLIGIGTVNPDAKLAITDSINTCLLHVKGKHYGNYSRSGIKTEMVKYGLDSIQGTEIILYDSSTGGTVYSATGNLIEMHGTGGGKQYGTYNRITNGGNGSHYGSYNNLLNISDTLQGNQFGTYNLIQSRGKGTSYGVYNSSKRYSGFKGLTYGVFSSLDENGTGVSYGVLNHIFGTGDASIYSIYNSINQTGSGKHYGVYTEISKGSNTLYGSLTEITSDGDGNHYGSSVELHGDGGGDQLGSMISIINVGDGTQFGAYNEINNSGTGTHYGTYNTLKRYPGFVGSTYGSYNGIKNNDGGSSYGVFNNNSGSGDANIHGVYNSIINSGEGTHYGVLNELSNGDGDLYGSKSDISSDGNGEHFGTYTALQGSGGGEQYGSRTEISNTGNNEHYGAYYEINNDGNGTHYGAYTNLSASGNGNQYGFYNRINNDGTGIQYGVYALLDNDGTGDKYGMYSSINSVSPGTHYGVYSDAIGSSNYAGYFKGRMFVKDRVGINTTNPNEFLEIAGSAGARGRMIASDGLGSDRRVILFISPSFANDYARIESYKYGTGSGGKELRFNTIGHGLLTMGGDVQPFSNNTYDLGSASQSWQDIYYYHLHMHASAMLSFGSRNVSSELLSHEFKSGDSESIDPSALPKGIIEGEYVNIDNFVSYNYKANYEQQQQLEILKKENAELKTRLEKLEKLLLKR